MLLDLQADPQAPAESLPLGLKVGRDGLRDYLLRVHAQGVAHVMFNLVDNGRRWMRCCARSVSTFCRYTLR